MDIREFRSTYPQYRDLSDEQVVDALHQRFYSDLSRSSVADSLGIAPRARSAVAAVNDTVIEAANAVAGGVGAVADFVSPGNRVSQFIDEQIIRPGEESQSDVVKAEKQRFRDEVQAADGIGGELSAVGGYVARNPVLSAAQAAGSFVVPGAAIKGGSLMARAAGMSAARAGQAGGVAAGAALSGGDAAGNAYDLVIQAGGSEEDAVSAARQASVLPAVVGGAGGALGAERLFAGAGKVAGGAARRALTTGASEALQEGIEEGVTEFEARRAAAPFDPSIDPTKGVAAAAGMGAVLGGGTGAALGAMSSPDVMRARADDGMRRISEGSNIDEVLAGAQDATATPLVSPSLMAQAKLTAAQESDAMGRLEQQAKDDNATIRAAGREDRTGLPPSAPLAVDEGSAQLTDAPLADRILSLREQMQDPVVREKVRARFGEDALNEVTYYASVADRADVNLPDRTRDNLLGVAERIVSESVLQSIPQSGALGSREFGTEALGMTPRAPQIGLDTTPTGTIRVDAAGTAAPETRADQISLRDRARTMRERRDGMTAQAPTGPQPASPAAPVPAIAYDTALTGRMIAGQSGVRAETNAESVNLRQRVNAMQAKRQAKADIGLTPDVEAAQAKRTEASDAPAAAGTGGRGTVDGERGAGDQRLPDQQPGPVQGSSGPVVAQGDAGAAPARDGAGAAHDALSVAAHEAATSPLNDRPEPSDAMKAAGNYAKGHARISGMDVSIENPKGSVRRSKADDPNPWQVEMPAHYGYIRRTTGADGDHVDLFVGDRGDNGRFWVVNQNKPGGGFDEHKVITGVDSAEEAVRVYKNSFSDGFGDKVFASVSGEMGAEALKAKLPSMRKARPVKPAPINAGAPEGEGKLPSGAEAVSTPPAAPAPLRERVAAMKSRKAARTVMGSDALGAINAGGGISPSLLADLSTRFETRGKTRGGRSRVVWRNPMTPRGLLFRVGGTSDLTELARMLEEAGFIEKGLLERDYLAARSKAQDIIQAALNRQAVLREGDADAIDDEMRRRADARMDETAEYPELDSEAAAEAEAERAAIMAEHDLWQADVDKLDDDDIPFDWPPKESSDARNEETDHARETSGARQDREDAREGPDPVPEARADAPRAADEEGLSAQTEGDLKAKAAREDAAAKADAAEQKRLADKAKADAQRDEFTLTGSDRPADVAAAGGQQDLLSAPAEPSEKTSAKPAGKITDFGETLHGARKHYAEAYKDRMAEAKAVDIAAEPLSKSWPEPDYAKLLEGGADPYTVAYVHAARDQVPTKPQSSWKLGRWVEQVKLLRDTSNQLLSGEITPAALREKLESKQFDRVNRVLGGAIELYQRVGHEKSLKGIELSAGSYSMFAGVKYEPAKTIWSVEQKAKGGMFGNWPRQIAIGDTREAALQAFVEKYRGLDLSPKSKQGTQFDIWRQNGKYTVGKKIGKEYAGFKTFDTVQEARAYKAEHQAELEAMLARYKDTPFERKPENAPRVGEDHRGGARVTPEVFAETFGFRGVQFGNYVEDSRRQQDLNDAYDALMDLAAVIGIPPRAVSLDGKLGLAFGARGTGGKNAAAAHYEPGTVVINLTKNAGAGSLAHEWFHATDNYFAKLDGGSGGFMTAAAKNAAVRPEMVAAFGKVQAAIRASQMRMRSVNLDKRKSKPYWATPHEMAARAFESYVIAKLQDQSAANDYLANVVGEKFWQAQEALGGHENEQTYPYPTDAEMGPIRTAFDGFFDTVQTKETDAGVALFSRASDTAERAEESLAADALRTALGPVASAWANGPKGDVTVVQTVEDLPPNVLRSVKAANADGSARAFFVPESEAVYLIADQLGSLEEAQFALFHEVYGHMGMRSVLGDKYHGEMLRLRAANPALATEASMWFAQYGRDEVSTRMEQGLTREQAEREVRALSVEEALADRAGTAPELRGWKRIASAIQEFLRSIGLNSVANWMEQHTEAETLALLVRARRAVERGDAGLETQPGVRPLFSRATTFDAVRSLDQQKVRDAVADLIGSAGAKVSWWDKTLGTQYAKAQKFPAYRTVFEGVQSYLEDTSSLANEAADAAPSILPKLETWRDLKKRGLSDADATAIAAPIFEGTLAEKRVFSDAELTSRYGLTAAQRGQYREFLAAVNASLDQAVAADVLRLLGDVPPAFRRLAMSDRAALRSKIDDFLTEQTQAQPESAARLESLRADIREKYARVDQLKAEGYAPLMRFGRYKVNVKGDSDSESLFFGLYESKAEANRMARELASDPEFKGRVIEQGVLSAEQYKLFSAVPIESLEMFAEAVGADQSEMFQAYLKLAKNNRSALKRLIHRKGTAGFSEDVDRVLAAFVTSNSRLAAGAMNLPGAKEAAQGIRDGDVQDEAIKLLDSVQNPQDTAGSIRGLMFMNFIGGSIASAVVNLTQPITMTLPYLSQWGGIAKASARLMAAGKMLAGGKVTPELQAALKRAEDDGIVSPQEIHYLQAQASAAFGTNPIAKRLAFIWGGPFSLAEQFNRRVSFIAAYQTAKEQGVENPFAFAERAVIETQGLYNRGNAPNWARNPLGAAALTFKQFSIHYLEWLTRMAKSGPAGRRAAVYALAILVAAAGTEGLPFVEDLDDLIDTLAQALGYDASATEWKREVLTTVLGGAGAEVMMRGLSSLPGVPIDVSIRMGMGNLLPATGILMRSNTDRSRDVLEVAGPAGSLAKQYLEAGQKALKGDAGGAVESALPMALRNVAKSVGMWTNGEYRDTRGNKVLDTDELDAAMKFMGFQPAEIARESQRLGEINRREQLAKNVEAEIAAKWARGMADKEPAVVAEARAELAEWNERNDAKIRVTSAQIIQRVRKLRQDRSERFLRTVAPERRAGVREEMR